MAKLTAERVTRIAKSHPCGHCREYTYKRVRVSPADASHPEELGLAWHAAMTCGVCGYEQELGINAEGEIVYAG